MCILCYRLRNQQLFDQSKVPSLPEIIHVYNETFLMEKSLFNSAQFCGKGKPNAQ